MKLPSLLQETLIGIQQIMGTNWWLEISTSRPQCTYYFGPFRSAVEAETAKPGYLQDLQQEGAEGITVHLQRCRNPGAKTICQEEF